MAELVSVVLCAYNGEKFIDEQIQSILSQSYSNIELIIFDDASSDKTVQCINEYKKDSRVTIFLNHQNIGLSAAVEKALQACTGEYICFSDQDDIWNENKIKLLVNSIKEENDWLVYSDSVLITEDGKSMEVQLSGFRNMHTNSNSPGFAFSNCVWGHAMIINKKLLQYILPIPPTVPHDSWIGFVAASVKRVKFLDRAVTQYRQHSNTVTTTIPQKYVSNAERNKADYLKNLNWLKEISSFENNPARPQLQKLYSLFNERQRGKFVWTLFWFVLKNQSLFYQFSKKSILSKINEIRKLARGVKLK